MDKKNLESEPTVIFWGDLLDTPVWTGRFQTLCEELKIADSVAVWSQIETWNHDGVLPESLSTKDLKSTTALKAYLKRIITAANQALQEPQKTKEDSLYHRLERCSVYKSLYQIDWQNAKRILIFAAARVKGSLAERLEIETGRFGAAQLGDFPNSYFYKQGNKAVDRPLKKDNGILARQTGKTPQAAQYGLVRDTSLQNLGRYLIDRRNFNLADANLDFSQNLAQQAVTGAHLDLFTFTNLAAQLQVYCPSIYQAARQIIETSVPTPQSSEKNLYFLGSVMRLARQTLKIPQQVNKLEIETNGDFEARVKQMFTPQHQTWANALKKYADRVGIKPRVIGTLI